MAKKQVIRVTESDLHRIIKESVNKILTESNEIKHRYWIDNGYATSPSFEATYEDAILQCLKDTNMMCSCWLYEVGKGEIGRTRKVPYGNGYAFFANDGKEYVEFNGGIKCY